MPKDREEPDEIDIMKALGIGDALCWSDLINEYRLIILAEAGSGKTEEIRHIASTLREQNKQAFFLRLEHIPGNFEASFEVGTYEAFLEWLKSEEEGWILLDSVDEARLRHPGDFELAIRKLSSQIQNLYNRAHIVITGRITAWRPKTDLDHCTNHLPYVVNTAEREPQANNGERYGEFLEVETKDKKSAKPSFRIVTLDDLTSEQIAKFAKARGIDDSKSFLDAVERADAWSFTARPQDLEELIEFWLDESRIGTRLEIMKNSIERRLAERDQDRADALPLSSDRARQGARLLAAATTLTRDPTIRIPDGAKTSKGISVQSVLDDWDAKEQATLLSRPIFDEAIYGTVRFHHRTVREYLTAEWFADLLYRERSRRAIEGLFFRNQYNLDVVVPTLRPILPWLVLLNEKIREHVFKVEPEIFFEGGDPSQLPLDLRRRILRDVCEQVASGTTGRSMHDYSAVQRFAGPDLTTDVRELIQKYADNDDLTEFLLRMVWIGQLDGLKHEVMNVALTPTTERYTRSIAFRAIYAIGSDEDQEHVRRSFLVEAPEIRRIWLAELVDGLSPTEETASWLLICMERTENEEPHSVDHLADRVTKFVESSDVELLPMLITGFNRLLNFPPMIEPQYCKVSERFQWLLPPASKAVERLVLARHPTSLEPDTLSVLHKLTRARDYISYSLVGIKEKFSELVSSWQDLKRAMFWFEVERERKASRDKKDDKRLTEFWQVFIFNQFWKFEVADFEYVVNEISRRDFIDDRLVALSLAFDLYKTAKRPRAWREQLKKLVKGDAELSTRLDNYLNPPAQDAKSRRWKQQEAKWKKRDEAHRKQQEKCHADWKKWFNDNLEDAQEKLRENPGIITNPIHYLFERTREKKQSSTRWTEYNWKTLIPEYGEDVARFYRNGVVSFWRHHKPKFHSEGDPLDKTTHAVIIGLTGLEIEAHEVRDWTKVLTPVEVELACRYAFCELNGFPTWLPKLFETHPEIVCEFLMQEIQYELSNEDPEKSINYALNSISWSGQWAWDMLAPGIYEQLEKEPQNLSNLDKLLRVVQGSNLSDDVIENLASRKCHNLSELKHLARWFAVWTGVSPETAITSLKKRISKIDDPQEQTLFAMIFVTHLFEDSRGDGFVAGEAFKTPEHLKSLYILMHEYIRPDEDIDRSGRWVYTPGLRDDAQDTRDKLLNMLIQIPGKESYSALIHLAAGHPHKAAHRWMMLQAKKKAEQDSDMESWLPEQVKDFGETIERTPRTHKELAELAVLRLLDLKDDIEHGDVSIAVTLQKITHETEMRNFIGREMREKAYGRYSIPQEEELADAKKPDLRFHGTGFDGPVPVELKLADNWSGPDLFERLENQLCGDYLQDNRSIRGIYLLVYRANKAEWDLPNGNRVSFPGLIEALTEHWLVISPEFPNIEDIVVTGIDLTCRYN